MDFTCTLNCPIDESPPFCCKFCHQSSEIKSHVNDDNKGLWTEQYGFWSETGCKLPRDKMPTICKEYDCRKFRHIVTRVWNGHGWTDGIWYELKPGEQFCKKDITQPYL